MVPTDPDYWLQRYETAMIDAADAPGERSRIAYLDLARHYWSMHMLVLGRPTSTPLPENADRRDESLMRWAA
jgi:hypothetical protein